MLLLHSLFNGTHIQAYLCLIVLETPHSDALRCNTGLTALTMRTQYKKKNITKKKITYSHIQNSKHFYINR